MANFDIRAIGTITITILLLTTYANAAVRCNQVASALAQCTSYVRTGEGNPTVQCCSGIKSLNSMATTDVEHQAVCKCLRHVAKGTDVNATAAAGLPGKCGVIVPFALSTTIDCNNKKPNIVVAQDGSGHFNSILDAIHSYMPSHSQSHKEKGMYVIYIKEGTYFEGNITVRQGQDNIYMYGDGNRKTIISGNISTGLDNITTAKTAIFSVDADNFTAKHMAFTNIAGPAGEQAVAFKIQGNYSAFFKCRFDGYQDTLYVQRGIQFFKECIISGTIDFIFGNSQAFFQNCDIYLKNSSREHQNVITASGRSRMNDTTGIVLQNCWIKASPDLKTIQTDNFLGRPWKQFARVVIMESYIDKLIHPHGWIRWNKNDPPSTIYFAEYANTGPGASTAKRVNWKGYHVLSRKQARKFTSKRFIHADQWMPNRTIPYYIGFTI